MSATDLALRAFEARPTRVEALADLARYFRERGMNEAAAMFGRRGCAIPPSDDLLFVETASREECALSLSICGYYSIDPETRTHAHSVCEELSLSRVISRETCEMARRNLFWFAPKLVDLAPSWSARRVKFTEPPGYRAMNPSVVRHGDRTLAIVRCVNYWIKPDGSYTFPQGEPAISTRNFLVDIDPFGATADPVEVAPDLGHVLYGGVLGLEDLRLFTWHDELRFIACARQMNEHGWVEQVTGRLSRNGVVTDMEVIRRPWRQPCEKNWMPIIGAEDRFDEPHFVYRCDPMTVVAAGMIAEPLRRPAAIAADNFSGSSQLIPFDDGWLAMTHEALASPIDGRRLYQQRFVFFGGNLSPVAYSRRFLFSLNEEIEYVAGLCWTNDDTLIVSYGSHDREAWIGKLSADDVRAILQPCGGVQKGNGSGHSIISTEAGSRNDGHTNTTDNESSSGQTDQAVVAENRFPYIARNRRVENVTFDLWMTDVFDEEWYGKEIADEQDNPWCLKQLRTGMTVVDCGCHHGRSTVVYSKAVGASGRVIAFDALAENIAVVERNLSLNKCENTEVHAQALGASKGVANFEPNHGIGYRANSGRLIQTVPLDKTSVSLSDRVDFIKIDVEGDELNVLRGALGIIDRQRPAIDIEVHNEFVPDRSRNIADILNLLSPYDYNYSSPGWDGVSSLNVYLSSMSGAPHLFCEPQRKAGRWERILRNRDHIGHDYWDAIGLDRTVALEVRIEARRRIHDPIRLITEVFPSWHARRLSFEAPPGFAGMAPCVINYGGRLVASIRCINYRVGDEASYYRIADGAEMSAERDVKPVSLTYMLEFDPETLAEHTLGSLTTQRNLAKPRPEARTYGFEDLRTFTWGGDLWAIAAFSEQSIDGFSEQWLVRLDLDTFQFSDARLICPQWGEPRRVEKNWMPIIGQPEPRFIYLCDPTTVVDAWGQLVSKRDASFAAECFHGGSQAIPFDGGWLALVHWMQVPGDTYHYVELRYRNRFVWFDKDFTLTRISPVWEFPIDDAVPPFPQCFQLAHGLCWHPDGKRLVMGYVMYEREPWVGILDADDVRNVLKRNLMPLSDTVDNDWISEQTNRPLQDLVAVYRATKSLRQLGLPEYNGCYYKNWDTLLAIWHASRVCSPNDPILDAGGSRSSTFLPGMKALGYQNLLNINIDEPRPWDEEGICFRSGDITNSGLPDHSQRFVMCQSVLEHGVDWRKFFDEMARIIKPGGGLFISVDYWERAIDNNVGIEIFTPEQIRALITYAERVGMRLSDHPTSDVCATACIEWEGLKYTFLNLLFSAQGNG